LSLMLSIYDMLDIFLLINENIMEREEELCMQFFEYCKSTRRKELV
jgi:hypothetical protein